jgi:hypothetical protein
MNFASFIAKFLFVSLQIVTFAAHSLHIINSNFTASLPDNERRISKTGVLQAKKSGSDAMQLLCKECAAT